MNHPRDINQDQWWTVPEVADYLHLSQRTIYNLMDAGRLAYRIFDGLRSRRIHSRDVRAYEAGETARVRVLPG